MALREELERSGNWLFRHRSYLPIVMLVPILVALHGYHYPDGRHDLDFGWRSGWQGSRSER